MPLPPPKPESLASVARRWGVSKMAVTAWNKKGYPVHNDRLLAEVLIKTEAPSRVKAKALEFTTGFTESTADPKGDDLETVGTHLAKTTLQTVEEIEKDILRYTNDQHRAEREGNREALEYATNQKLKFQKALIEVRMRLKKMGEESGKQISKPEFEQIISAMASRAALGVHQLIQKISLDVCESETAEEAIGKLEPLVLAELFVDPFVRAAGLAAGCGMPAWVVDGIKTAIGDHIEDGESFVNQAA